MRALATVAILVGVDDERGPQLYKVDPAGHFFPFKVRGAVRFAWMWDEVRWWFRRSGRSISKKCEKRSIGVSRLPT